MSGPLVLKLGGELLESTAERDRLAAAVASMLRSRPVVVVHGGGRSVDASMQRQGLSPTKVDGLRITDEATLDVVVSVLAGLTNTQLVAALVGRGVPAVGLTGVDAGLARATRAAALRATSGAPVDLGLVGDPAEPDVALLELLLVNGYVPVIASLGIEVGPAYRLRQGSGGQEAGPSVYRVPPDGGAGFSPPGTGPVEAGATILNVNADVMAARLAAVLGAELVIAGATPGVLDRDGTVIEALDPDGIDRVITDGTATAGMIAKLSSCREALADGVACVRIIDGRMLDTAHGVDDVSGTALAASIGGLSVENSAARRKSAVDDGGSIPLGFSTDRLPIGHLRPGGFAPADPPSPASAFGFGEVSPERAPREGGRALAGPRDPRSGRAARSPGSLATPYSCPARIADSNDH